MSAEYLIPSELSLHYFLLPFKALWFIGSKLELQEDAM